MNEALAQVIQKNKQASLEFLKELISADSTDIEHGVYGNEINAQRVVEAKLKELGFGVDVFEPDNKALEQFPEMNPGHHYENRPNVVGTLKGTGGGRSLILNGHIDTMPFDHLEEWITHPLKPIEKDGRLYGRGACDMKGGVGAMIMAMECIRKAGIELKGDVIVQTVVDEEGGGNGSMATIARGYRADAAIITEPTELEIMPAHMGWLFYKMEVKGKALHAAMKWKGVNAIEKTMKIMQALQELERTWCMTKRHPHLPPPTINFGTIHGGMAGSVVADSCVLDFGLHYLPTDRDENGMGSLVEKELFDAINLACDGDEWLRENRPTITLYQLGSGYEIDFNHELIQLIDRNYTEFSGNRPVIRGCEYGSDARLLTNYGHTPTVLFGPGSIAQAHGINEYISIDQYYSAIEILAQTIVDWCNG